MGPADAQPLKAEAGLLASVCAAVHAGIRRVAAVVLRASLIPYAVAVVAALAFAPSLGNGFVDWDDHINLLDNPHYRGLGWTQLRWMATSTLMGHYIPVTWLTFGLDYTLWGMNPLGYHLTNVLIHAVNAALFYLVALALLRRATAFEGSTLRLAAAVAALFFALHPLRVESVAWATERRDVLSGLFFLLTVLLYLNAVAAPERRRRWLLAVSLATYALALLSKSIVMTLPFVLLLLDIYPLGRLPLRRGAWREPAVRGAAKELAPYLILGLAGAAVSYWAVASNNFLTSSSQYGWPARIGIAAYSLWFYIHKTALPLMLSPMYELPLTVNPLEPRFLLSALAVLGMGALALLLRRRVPGLLAAFVYYGIVLGPVTGIVHSGHQLTHDRYSYLSCLGWALLIGAAVGMLARAAGAGVVRPALTRVAAVVVAGWILALATLTWYQIQVWRDTETLWRYAAESDPSCSICQNNVGVFYYRQRLYEHAKERYETALALRPDRTRVHGNLGLALHSMGDVKGGLHHIELALKAAPDDPKALSSMAYVLLADRRPAEALPYLERAHRIDPAYVPALVNLGLATSELGRPEEGLLHIKRALELKPDEASVHVGLARVYLMLGEHEAARRAFDAAAELDPGAARALEPAFFTVW